MGSAFAYCEACGSILPIEGQRVCGACKHKQTKTGLAAPPSSTQFPSRPGAGYGPLAQGQAPAPYAPPAPPALSPDARQAASGAANGGPGDGQDAAPGLDAPRLSGQSPYVVAGEPLRQRSMLAMLGAVALLGVVVAGLAAVVVMRGSTGAAVPTASAHATPIASPTNVSLESSLVEIEGASPTIPTERSMTPSVVSQPPVGTPTVKQTPRPTAQPTPIPTPVAIAAPTSTPVATAAPTPMPTPTATWVHFDLDVMHRTVARGGWTAFDTPQILPVHSVCTLYVTYSDGSHASYPGDQKSGAAFWQWILDPSTPLGDAQAYAECISPDWLPYRSYPATFTVTQ